MALDSLDSFTYEQRLAQDTTWAMSEGSRHFEGDSAVQTSLQDITQRLEALGIDYALAGGMALFLHGFRRFTEDIDILVTREGLKVLHEQLEGRGYRPPFPGSRNLRDTQNGVRIEFLIAGQFPGDGKPKPVAFPEPHTVSEVRNGTRLLNLPAIIELKLASGMTNPDRLKDLSDVQELIKIFALPEKYSEQLHPYVQPKFAELWYASRGVARRYVRVWEGEPFTGDIASLEEAVQQRPDDSELRAMAADSIEVDLTRSHPEIGRLFLFSNDPVVAERQGLHDESELWDDTL